MLLVAVVQDVAESAESCFDVLSTLSACGICPLVSGVAHDGDCVAQISGSDEPRGLTSCFSPNRLACLLAAAYPL